MLVISQIALTDLRSLVAANGHRTPKPNWSVPRTSDFIRKFGQISPPDAPGGETRRELEQLGNADRHAIEMRRVRIECGPSIRHRFTRIFSDGSLSTRIELGFLVKTPDREALRDFRYVLSQLHEIRRARVRFNWRGPSDQNGDPQFEDFGALETSAGKFRKAYAHYTTQHGAEPIGLGRRAVAPGDLLRPESMASVIIFPASYPLRWLRKASRQPYDAKPIQICAGIDVDPDKSLQECFFVGNYNAKAISRIRLLRHQMLDFLAEVKSYSTVLRECDGGLLDDPAQVNTDTLNRFLGRQASHLGDLSRRIGDALGFEYSPFRDKEMMEPLFSKYEQIQSKYRRSGRLWFKSERNLNDAGALTQLLAIPLEAPVGPTFQFNGPITWTGDNVENKNVAGNNYGFMGQTKAETINAQQYHIQLADNRLPELAGQLEALVNQARGAATSADHYRQLAAASEAAEACKSGDKSSVAGKLASCGKWLLDIGKDIGVSVASDAIKQAAGLS